MRLTVMAVSVMGWLASACLVGFAQADIPDSTSYVEVNGVRLFVRTVGAGAPLIIVHGGPGMSHDYLAPQLVDLLASEYRLVFYDQRASGRSSGVEDTAGLTMGQFVEDLEGLRLALGLEQLDLLGHSFGGLLAMYYAAEYPQAINKLLLVDSSPASWQLNFPYFRQTIAERQTEMDREEMARLLSAPGARSDPLTMDRYYKLFFRTFFNDPQLSESLELGIDEQWLEKNAITGGRIWESIGEYDIHDRLGRINAPTLILHGTGSVLAMEGAEAIAARIPRSRLIRFRDVGHFPYVEAPESFAAAVKGISMVSCSTQARA
jgi:proline iminopeptidase